MLIVRTPARRPAIAGRLIDGHRRDPNDRWTRAPSPDAGLSLASPSGTLPNSDRARSDTGRSPLFHVRYSLRAGPVGPAAFRSLPRVYQVALWAR